MKDLMDAIKFAMSNGGNPLILCSGEKRLAADALLNEFSAKAAVLFSRLEIVEALESNKELDVIIWDGDSKEKSYLEKAFLKFPNARRVCFAEKEFFSGEPALYDTTIVG
jgi:hypothetical protein